MTSDLLSRDEVLGGLPAKRASALLFLIESRTAHLADRDRHAIAPFRSEEAARERELGFVEAFALGREPPLKPTIQDLERHAPEWAELVPRNPGLRAAVAHLLGEKYQFTASATPALQRALGLDEPAVQRAYERFYREPLESVYTARPSLGSRVRWAWAALGDTLEALPPFWIVYAIAVAATIGAGMMTMPVVLAGIGPLPGVALVIILGLVSMLTSVWLAEATVRTGAVRYGGAYFGRMVTEYLGKPGGSLWTAALTAITALAALSTVVGLASTMATATAIPAIAWIGLHCVVLLITVSRIGVSSTLASVLCVSGVKLALGLALVGLGFLHLDVDNLRHVRVPGIDGQAFEPALVGLVFGVIISAFLAHHVVCECWSLVMRRDPEGRSLIRGVAAAQATGIVVYAISVLGIIGGVSSERLAGTPDLPFQQLADVAGPAVYTIGASFVVLAMGLTSIDVGAALVSTVGDWLPGLSRPVVALPRDGAHLVLTARGGAASRTPTLRLTYRGLDSGQPHLRLEARLPGRTQRLDRSGREPWAIRADLDRFPADALQAVDAVIEPIVADAGQVRLRVTTRMRIRYEGTWTAPGLDLAGLLDGDAGTTDADSALLAWMLRQGKVQSSQVAARLGTDARQAETRLRALVASGAVREARADGVTTWRANVAHRRPRHASELLDKVGEVQPISRKKAPRVPGSMRDRIAIALSDSLAGPGQRIARYSPLVLVFVVAGILQISGNSSYNYLMSLMGMLAVPVVAGVFPCLLLVASRRRGDLVPGTASRLLGNRWLVMSIYTVFVAVVLLHGLVIWQHPAERAAAIGLGALLIAFAVAALRRGAFTRRTVVTLHDDQRPGGMASLAVVSSGNRTPVDARLDLGDRVEHIQAASIAIPDIAALREIAVRLPPAPAMDLKLWANRVTPAGETVGLPAHAAFSEGDQTRKIDLQAAGGQAALPYAGHGGDLVITLDRPSRRTSARKQVADPHTRHVPSTAPVAEPDTIPAPDRGT